MSGGEAPARAVLFDLDGVLIDSFEAWLATVQAVARAFDAPPVTRERLRALFGQGVAGDAEVLFPGRSEDEIREAYDRTLPDHVERMTLNPEAHAVLDALGERGIRRAIVTNTQEGLARRILRVKGLLERVEAWAATAPPLREKPHPDLLLAALEELGVAADDAWMVGDSRYDEEASRAAGTTFVRYDVRADEDLREALAALLA